MLLDCAIHNFKDRGIALVFGGRADLSLGVSVTNCGTGISNASGIILGDEGGGLTISNCNGDGINIFRNATARLRGSYLSNNGRDSLSCTENSSARANTSVISNNGRRGVTCRENSSIQVRGSIVTDNGDTGVLATTGGYIDFTNTGASPSVLSGNRSPSSPALNTEGSGSALIKSNLG